MSSPIRAWVIGAGFSKSLGGPLLPDLLSLNAWAEVRTRYSNVPHLEGYDAVYWLYHYGSQFSEGVPGGRQVTGIRAWRDAEEFLELLAVGTESQAVASKVRHLITDIGGLVSSDQLARRQHDIEKCKHLDVLARRLVGAACCAFLDDVDGNAVSQLEKWRPYRDWYGQLREGDFLISFNYDRVIELLNAWRGSHGDGLALKFVTTDDEASAALSSSQPALMKLHGSVDWKTTPGGSVKIWADPRWALNCPDEELALAAPGPAKMRIARNSFGAIWELAEKVLRTADEIYFLGYRFPPSDAESRSRLLGAIKGNERAEEVRLHLVLGPDTHGAHVIRQQELLREVISQTGRLEAAGGAPSFRVRVHPLWVEDFLTLWHPAMSIQGGGGFLSLHSG